ncbi:MAG: thermonuclease family protein [Anaerolineae bacterium]
MATPGRVRAQVVRVDDGDTIQVEIAGQVYRVRYIGMDCPEGTELFGTEATRKNAELVAGKVVELERDVSETDRYGRLLRYVWVGGLLVNGELVRLGYARARAYPPDVRYHDLFVRLEEEARSAGRGLWGLPPTATAAPQTGACDPAYPTVCIPPPPPDLDCGDIPYRRFPVLPPDPHHFDGDHDGVGCEGG